MIGADENAVAGLEKKFRIDQSAKDRVAELPVEPEQTLRLRGRQSEAGHLDELALDAAQRFFNPCSLREHWLAPPA